MKKLIVNADDFGLTLGVCDGIIKGHLEGAVTSTTILVNSPHIKVALEKLKQAPRLDMGVHLNITWGKPINDIAKVKSLVGSNGLFIRRTNFDEANLDEIALEWQAQIDFARSLGLNITHVDTHHHTHRNPALLDILLEIVEQEKLAARSQESWIRDFLRANGVRTTDHFIEDFYGEGKTTEEHLEDLLRFSPDGSTEICCHPAIVDEELRKISSYNEPRTSELAVLTSSTLKNWLRDNDFEFSSFADLPAPSGVADKSCELK